MIAAGSPVVVTTSTMQNASPHQNKYRRLLRNLGITEVVFGVILIILGGISAWNITAGATQTLFGVIYTNGVTAWEGVWGGIWIIVAGGLGIGSGKSDSNNCLVNTHMAFSILGSIVSFSMVIIGIAFALISVFSFNPLGGIVVNSLIAVISLVCFVLLIVSASYCCAFTGCCKANTREVVAPVVYTQQTAESAPEYKSNV